jgi:hypothetical protein
VEKLLFNGLNADSGGFQQWATEEEFHVFNGRAYSYYKSNIVRFAMPCGLAEG